MEKPYIVRLEWLCDTLLHSASTREHNLSLYLQDCYLQVPMSGEESLFVFDLLNHTINLQLPVPSALALS